ncbi:transposase, partial [Shigella boydii]
STLKSPSYTKSVSWQHYPFFVHRQTSKIKISSIRTRYITVKSWKRS